MGHRNEATGDPPPPPCSGSGEGWSQRGWWARSEGGDRGRTSGAWRRRHELRMGADRFYSILFLPAAALLGGSGTGWHKEVTSWPEVRARGRGVCHRPPRCSGSHSGGLAEPQDSQSLRMGTPEGQSGRVCSAHTWLTSAPGGPCDPAWGGAGGRGGDGFSSKDRRAGARGGRDGSGRDGVKKKPLARTHPTGTRTWGR